MTVTVPLWAVLLLLFIGGAVHELGRACARWVMVRRLAADVERTIVIDGKPLDPTWLEYMNRTGRLPGDSER